MRSAGMKPVSSFSTPCPILTTSEWHLLVAEKYIPVSLFSPIHHWNFKNYQCLFNSEILKFTVRSMNFLTKPLKSHTLKPAFKAKRQKEFRAHYLDAGGLPDAHDKHLPSHFQVCPWHLSCFLPLALSAVFPFHLKISTFENIQIQNCQAEQNGEESLFPCRKEDTQSGKAWKVKVNTRSRAKEQNYQGTSRTPWEHLTTRGELAVMKLLHLTHSDNSNEHK